PTRRAGGPGPAAGRAPGGHRGDAGRRGARRAARRAGRRGRGRERARAGRGRGAGAAPAGSGGVTPGPRHEPRPSRKITDRPSAASTSGSVTVRYPGSPSTAAPGKRAARAALTGPSSAVGATAPASSYQEFFLTQLVIRTLRLNLQKASATGS